MCGLCVEEAGVKVDEIGAAPLGVLPVGLADAPLDGDARSGRELGCGRWGDLVLGVEGHEMRHVAMAGFGFSPEEVATVKPRLDEAELFIPEGAMRRTI